MTGSALTNSEIAKDWRSRAESVLRWKRCSNQAGVIQGEAGGYFVEAEGFPRRAYLKPAKSHRDNASSYARAAREKIAADLAFELGLSVPPAQLTIRDDAPADCERSVVVSLVMYPRQYPWEIVKQHALDTTPPGLAIAKVLADCSSMLAFDTWIEQIDHGDHPHNIVWGYDPSSPATSELVFLDFAFSMGFQGNWKSNGWKTVAVAPFPANMINNLDKKLLAKANMSIRNFNETTIEEIVFRVPDSHMARDQKTMIVEGLVGRRNLVADMIDSKILSSA